jgi:hypothetical protein
LVIGRTFDANGLRLVVPIAMALAGRPARVLVDDAAGHGWWGEVLSNGRTSPQNSCHSADWGWGSIGQSTLDVVNTVLAKVKVGWEAK